MKFGLLSFVAVIFFSTQVAADDYGMPLDDESIRGYVEEAMADDSKNLDVDELFDINGDNLISINEARNLATALVENGEAGDDAYMLGFFYAADENGDEVLDKGEAKLFADSLQRDMLSKKFKAMDVNGDGVYNAKDLPSREEIEANFNEGLAKLEEATAKLEEVDSDVVAKNMIGALGAASRDEDFFMTDVNKNGCVEKDEYVKFEYAKQKEYEEDEKYWMSEDDFKQMYDEFYGTSGECLTKEKYVEQYVKMMDEGVGRRDDEINVIDEEIKKGEAELEAMDSGFEGIEVDEGTKNRILDAVEKMAHEDFLKADDNKNGCLDKGEFVSLRMDEQKKSGGEEKYWLTTEDFGVIYDKDYGVENECLTEEMFVKKSVQASKAIWK